MRTYQIFLAAVLTLTACHNTPSSKAEKVTDVQLVAPPPPVSETEVNEKARADANQEIVVEEPVGNSDVRAVQSFAPPVVKPDKEDVARKIIKEGELSFETKDVIKTRKQLLNSLKRFNGYVERDQESAGTEGDRKEYQLYIRIPAANFEAFLDGAANTAYKIDSKNIRVHDVSTEYIDTKARLDNKKVLEARYQELLKKAVKIADMLQIEDKLTEIRSDIESTQQQLNFMQKQVAYSSLNITFYTRQASQIETAPGFGKRVLASLGDGLSGLENLLFGLISAWPLLLVAAIALVLIKRWRSHKRVVAE
ncbi:DUF4349 domain-containing protein [Mucilaginibacter terrenus]|uniref:DUF4349 domain-containing protein n=1 Tax=Mucilaginibacter terrenus TaxID=2482727 RepID=A0A3E2NPA8_9SPHI|nr:DUF4349 domain-containing protein [Mucilaginibacter terrenus]RFZ82845.1 DUF4349 domain-containing protein [Mucilaginibacter terrenus]